MENIKEISAANTAVEAVDIFQAAAWEMDSGRPLRAGYWHAEVLPVRHDGNDWTWCRVDTRGTGNGGRWVATRPLSERGRALRCVLMDTLARLLPGFSVAYLATKSLFWESAVLEWMNAISPEMATWLGNQPSVESRRQAEAIKRQGFTLPKTSIPRTSAAIAMAAEAARRAK
jgi:hypothetical protein